MSGRRLARRLWAVVASEASRERRIHERRYRQLTVVARAANELLPKSHEQGWWQRPIDNPEAALHLAYAIEGLHGSFDEDADWVQEILRNEKS